MERRNYSRKVAKGLRIRRYGCLYPSALIISNRGGHARFPTWRLQKAQVRFAVTRDLRIVSREMACYSSRFTLGIPSLPSDPPGMESRAHFSYASQVTHSQGSPLTIGVLPASGHPSPVFWSNPMNPCQNDPCLEWGQQFRATMAP